MLAQKFGWLPNHEEEAGLGYSNRFSFEQLQSNHKKKCNRHQEMCCGLEKGRSLGFFQGKEKAAQRSYKSNPGQELIISQAPSHYDWNRNALR